MQRQSLGSPGSKLHGGGAAEERRRSAAGCGGAAEVAASDVAKAEKPICPSSTNPEKSIHLIPVLTLLCFLVLYLCSHDPSPTDLASFGGANKNMDNKVASSGADIGRWIGADGVSSGGAVARLSQRELMEAAKLRHRKLRIC